MQTDRLRLGATFSRKACIQLNLNPASVLAAVLENTNIRHFRLMSYWNDIEHTKGIYDFEWLDQDIKQITDAGGTFSLCLGLRQPRWPECHRPRWAKELSGKALTNAVLKFNEVVVNRYKSVIELKFWQLENEALNHGIGTCKDFSRKRLLSEYKSIKKLDPNRSILMSTSNSWGIPLRRPIPDIVGFSLYRSQHNGKEYSFRHLPAWGHKLRAFFVKTILRKRAYIHELQAEPWGPTGTERLSIKEQNKSMDLRRLKESLAYAKATGIVDVDIWGVEWMYWRLKSDPSLNYWEILADAMTSTNDVARK